MECEEQITLLVSGMSAGRLSDDPEVIAVMAYLPFSYLFYLLGDARDGGGE